MEEAGRRRARARRGSRRRRWRRRPQGQASSARADVRGDVDADVCYDPEQHAQLLGRCCVRLRAVEDDREGVLVRVHFDGEDVLPRRPRRPAVVKDEKHLLHDLEGADAEHGEPEQVESSILAMVVRALRGRLCRNHLRGERL